ncbi:gag/pol polyprotein [Tanacetum coccineum]
MRVLHIFHVWTVAIDEEVGGDRFCSCRFRKVKSRCGYESDLRHVDKSKEIRAPTLSFRSLNWKLLARFLQAMKLAKQTQYLYDVVPRSSNTNVVDCKWVYKLKLDKNGAITRYKARFVSKGFRQQPVKRILRYLHGTVRSSGSTLQAFTDVLWKEVEYKALADIVTELTWIQALLYEHDIHSSSTPIQWCDNLGATYLSANPIFYARTKHVEIDYHFVWEKFAQGDIRFQHISTHDQIADIFTKSLSTPRFIFLRSKLQVVAFP